MNASEKNKMTMFRAVDAVMTQHRETIDALPPLAESVTKFSGSLTDILQLDNEYVGVAEGATAAKNSSLDDCVERAFRICNALYALGRKTGNEQLKASCGVSISDITKMRETDIEQHCSRIADLAQESTTDLAVYGINAAEIKAFRKALETYRQQADSKHSKTAESKAARKSLYEAFCAADEILREDIDSLIELVKAGNADFYNQYKAARTIRDLGGHITKNNKAAPDDVPEQAGEPAAV